MSLVSNLSDLATRIATEFKAIRILISGSGTGGVGGLNTTATDLVGAINEVLAGSSGAPPAASDTVAGVVELATSAETVTGTDTTRATTPAGVAAAIGDAASDTLAAAQTYADSKVMDSIAVGDTAHAPSSNAVFDALALKADASAVQPLDPELTALAGLVSAADRLPYFTGSGTAALAVLTAAGRALIAAADAAAQRTVLGLGTAATADAGDFDSAGAAATAESNANAYADAAVAALVNSAPAVLDTLQELAQALGNDPNFATTMTTALAGKQPLDAELTALAGLASTADTLPYFTGSGTAALATLTLFGRSLIAAANAAAARATLSVYSQAEIGDPATNFVATFEAGLT